LPDEHNLLTVDTNPTTTISPKQAKPEATLGIASFTCALAAVVCFGVYEFFTSGRVPSGIAFLAITWLGNLSIPATGVALVLGIVSIVQAHHAHRKEVFGLIGLILSALSIVFTLMGLVLLIGGLAAYNAG
jgi:hypothetical protein